MPEIDYKKEVRRLLIDKLNHATSDWSRALNDARIAEAEMKLLQKAIAEFDEFGTLIV
jgi:hypothetical protein